MKRRPAAGRTSGKPHLWRRSAEFRAIAVAAIRRFNAERHLHPICGAKAKSTGEPCRRIPAKGRTRCKLHGGATPRGDGPAGWHTPGFPNGLPTGKPRSDAHKARKRRQRRAEIAAMTAAELARLEAWRHTHKPGSRRDRAHGRHAREARQWLDTIMQEAPSAPTPDQAELDALRARFRAHLAQLEAEIAEAVEDEPPVGGLFD
ncbi:HGGxSTG domain-containing protein [Methylobacterium sp. 092160098-2]|uniref:HGGxSTG domain-containing protein n=1 Tax=Methylobacterium sp. 092160098-2 TaxID=3025129 RepID=UPI002381CBDD|nr:HGGxSTG domain-containing protein [Methylobacterium sp. 092160098-2]MDE4913859.1 HGGxSTG domain-containing protein [Methylobacterium sp. 092160098-2]